MIFIAKYASRLMREVPWSYVKDVVMVFMSLVLKRINRSLFTRLVKRHGIVKNALTSMINNLLRILLWILNV